MNSQLDELNDIVNQFYKVAPQGAALCDMLRRSTALVYFLETHRAEIHKQWIATYHNTDGTNAANASQHPQHHQKPRPP